MEQLRVHVRNLGALAEDLGEGDKERRIELFEKGYGKDAAGIAKDAITYGKSLVPFSSPEGRGVPLYLFVVMELNNT